MLFNSKKPCWLRHGERLINLENVDYFETNQQPKGDAVNVFFRSSTFCVLRGISLDDIHYFLKHGRPRKSRE
jgi:hypothetical protein